MTATATIVGAGPGGLMAAEVLATAGFRVTIYEHMASPGRKLLLAGRGGLNITHSRPLDELLARYRSGPSTRDGDLVAAAVRAYGPDELRAWCASLGEPTFVGSSGRVFPASFRATPLLRAWLVRLAALGVTIETRHRWSGWAVGVDGVDPRRHVFEHTRRSATGDVAGERVEVSADVTVLALGGASWPRVGSDGGWVEHLTAAGVEVHALRPANCGVRVAWSPEFVDRFAGVPLKNVAVGVVGATDRHVPVRGDAMITASGLEGGPVYDRSSAIREAIDRDGRCTVELDLQPDLTVEQLAARLSRRRAKDSTTTWIRRATGLSPVAIGVLRHASASVLPDEPGDLAASIKSTAVVVESTMPIDRAISSAGGVAGDEVDDRFMLRRMPGTFVVGEMLDWDAPTGGYLLQATFSTAVAAARGASSWIAEGGGDRRVVEIDAGDTLWRFDVDFLESNWTCIWGRGCQGIGSEPAPHLDHGCCSIGAALDDLDEARTLSAMAAMLSPDEFEYHDAALADGIFSDETNSNTRVIDGACIFLNRAGHPSGAGCALHVAALTRGESPVDWKPPVCWQLPVKVDWEMRADDVEVATVRAWRREDWGDDGDTMAWCCTEEPDAFVGDRPVVETLADELIALVGEPVYVELRRRRA